MRLSINEKLEPVRSRLRKTVTVICLLVLIAGIGMLLYRVQAPRELQVQGERSIQSVALTSQLKANLSKIFGPIVAVDGSWLDLNAVSNKSITMQIRSNSTGTIFNSTGTTFGRILLLTNSTGYYVTATNPRGAAASIQGNATLATLSVANVSIENTKRPLLLEGVALVAIGAISMLYVSLPKDPGRSTHLVRCHMA